MDARSPLLFRSPDLEKWTVSLGNKETLLLVNKADLLNERQRKAWAEYFSGEGIPFVFFSARVESEKNQNRDDDEDDDDEEDDEDEEPEQIKENSRLVGADELLQIITKKGQEIVRRGMRQSVKKTEFVLTQ